VCGLCVMVAGLHVVPNKHVVEWEWVMEDGNKLWHMESGFGFVVSWRLEGDYTAGKRGSGKRVQSRTTSSRRGDSLAGSEEKRVYGGGSLVGSSSLGTRDQGRSKDTSRWCTRRNRASVDDA